MGPGALGSRSGLSTEQEEMGPRQMTELKIARFGNPRAFDLATLGQSSAFGQVPNGEALTPKLFPPTGCLSILLFYNCSFGFMVHALTQCMASHWSCPASHWEPTDLPVGLPFAQRETLQHLDDIWMEMLTLAFSFPLSPAPRNW